MVMNLMSGRELMLQQVVMGTHKCGVQLVGYDHQNIAGITSPYHISESINHVIPAGLTDDLGIYYFIPKLIQLTGLSLSNAILVFFCGILLASLALGIWGISLIFKNIFLRVIAAGVLFQVINTAYAVGDVYAIEAAVPIALLPLFIAIIKLPNRSLLQVIFLFLSGIIIVTANFIRAYAGIPTVALMLVMLLFDRVIKIKWKTILLVSLVLGGLIPSAYFNSLVQQRDDYLKQQIINYQAPLAYHPLWSSIYEGLGYLKNPYGLVYSDAAPILKVWSIDKNIALYSPEFQDIIKHETINFILKHPKFFIETILEKLKIICFYGINPLYIALICLLMLFYSKGWVVEGGFTIAVFLSALPPALVMPDIKYMLGFVALIAIYMLVSLEPLILQGSAFLKIMVKKKVHSKI